MEKKDEFLLSNLYVNKVSLTKEIPNDNYLKELSVVKHLRKGKH